MRLERESGMRAWFCCVVYPLSDYEQGYRDVTSSLFTSSSHDGDPFLGIDNL
jgi:hypothetical protein